ncbi:response regulator transcription factor [Sphingobium sp. DC-2]|uniref:response regulator transcription factor n=1 Tax=Sphingobium sp. DC-2 TaxID=1303256 RepID=UPI000B239676|nr:response regulator transcription factor [Sphingobium sp. DC-2]
MSLNLLIVEDDEDLAEQLGEQLKLFGHQSTIVGDGRRANHMIAARHFDAVILDRILPMVDGVTLLKSLREHNILTPVIMMTALGQSRQKIEGLESGADDYVVKPVDPAELNARLQALVRARGWTDKGADETLRVGDLVVSPARHSAWRDGKALRLQKTEFKVLIELVRNAGMPVTRAMLLERVWNYDFEPATNLVDAHIRRLRIKLMEFGGDDPIVTIRGLGYMIRG